MPSELEVPFEKYFVAAKAIVLNEKGEMLCLLRGASAPTNPLHWDMPGGILEYGEALQDCIEREIKEESGLSVDSLRPFHAIARKNSLGEFWTTIYYAAHTQSQEVTISWEHDEWRWVAPEDFVTLTVPNRQRETVERFIELRDQGKV